MHELESWDKAVKAYFGFLGKGIFETNIGYGNNSFGVSSRLENLQRLKDKYWR